ncbi:DUF4136 domain-containing protein [Adhaeribacter sp. BT258]|uniref:DUF4136 domain-containing protein n=1 Tax=Adhaeribacter terrigena TaxID=2793070 RepID=A0ABS1C4L1_9BACT|nr:DUF4136 domain-containing protein [Adhaeribacter terrigena]MBK0404326.1 DUF4136 domain-containing protein [Adhaeribacter terrigena]
MSKIYLLTLVLGLFLSGCASVPVDVSTDYDRAANFNQFTTFRWFQENPSARRDSTRSYNTFLDKRIRAAVEANLARKGFRMTTANPDVLVAYDVKVVTKQEVRPDYSYPPGWYGGYGWWYGYRYNYGYSRFAQPMYIDQYQDGTIIIDLIDAKDNELVWRGWGQMEVGSTNVSEAEVNKIVTKILEKYPPGSDK